MSLNQLQNLLHDSLIATGHVEQCAVIKRKDSSIKATSIGYAVDADECRKLVAAFKSPSSLRETGLVFGDVRYECVRADRTSIYAKSKSRGGLIATKTATFVVTATYSATMTPSVCVDAVERLASYFRDKSK
ncbi:profilin-4-like [Oscarella lobularis]|uniref:profilin-4-like n=1 Tax=Oscarella lobularis TaxID=121494 RepID=UPI0033141F7C